MENSSITVEDNAETELLAALLQRSVWDKVNGLVSPSDFTDPRHRHLFEAIEAIERSGKVADITTVVNRFAKTFRLQDIGGREYVLAIAKKKRRMSVDSAVASLRSRRGASA